MEMPLSAYKSKFIREPRGEEGFGNAMGKPYRGRQVSRRAGGEEEIQGYFSQKDRAVITHPRTARMLEQRLANSAYNFNILMLERAGDKIHVGDYESRQVGEFIETNNIRTEGHITFVKNGTSGHVMTPWMILHTLGHAAFAQAALERNIRLVFMKILNELADALCGNEEPRNPARMPPHKCLTMLGDALMFRSVQRDSEDPAYNNDEELFHELVAEFLWNGDRIRVGGPRSGGVVPAIVRKLEDAVREVLDSCVGHVIFDYFG